MNDCLNRTVLNVCLNRALKEEQMLHSKLAADIRSRTDNQQEQQLVSSLTSSLEEEQQRCQDFKNQLANETAKVKELNALLRIEQTEGAKQLDNERAICRKLKNELNSLQVSKDVLNLLQVCKRV